VLTPELPIPSHAHLPRFGFPHNQGLCSAAYWREGQGISQCDRPAAHHPPVDVRPRHEVDEFYKDMARRKSGINL
jgi:hypothetical protein